MPFSLRHRNVNNEYGQQIILGTIDQGICMSKVGFTLTGILALAILAVGLSVAVTLSRSSGKMQ